MKFSIQKLEKIQTKTIDQLKKLEAIYEFLDINEIDSVYYRQLEDISLAIDSIEGRLLWNLGRDPKAVALEGQFISRKDK